MIVTVDQVQDAGGEEESGSSLSGSAGSTIPDVATLGMTEWTIVRNFYLWFWFHFWSI